LWYIYRFVVGDTVWQLQGNYAQFHLEAFDKDQKFSPKAWRDLDPALRDELCSAVLTKPMFLGIILFLWVGRMMGEFKTCVHLVQDVSGLASVPHEGHAHHCVAERDGTHHIKGMKLGTRLLIYTLVVIPKFVICILLTIVGLEWLAATDNFAALILNALVLGFIVDIDEHILQFFLPQRCAAALEVTKFAYPRSIVGGSEEEKEEERLSEMVKDYIRNVVYLTIAVAIAYVYIMYLQQVVPWFAHDVKEHCGPWFENRFIPKCTPFMKGCFPFGSGTVPPHDISYDGMLPQA